MLHIQSELYEMLPIQNVTIRKCTIPYVTDPVKLVYERLGTGKSLTAPSKLKPG